jgi:putative membrane protein
MGKLISLLIFALLVVLFASQNTAMVHLHFLAWKSQDISLALVIIASAALGAVLALVASIPTHRRRSKELAAKRREVDDLRERVH